MPAPITEWTWDPSRWLSSPDVRFFTDYQRGWYAQLINESMNGNSEWPPGHLPNDSRLCQELVGATASPSCFKRMPEQIKKLVPSKVWVWFASDFDERWQEVWRKFKPSEQHREFVIHPAVKIQLSEKLTQSSTNRVNGLLSAAARRKQSHEWGEGGMEIHQQMQNDAEEFWKLYPPCENKTNKLRADEVFKVVIGNKWAEAKPAIEKDIAYRLAHSWKDRRFVPKPENYLAEQYWLSGAHSVTAQQQTTGKFRQTFKQLVASTQQQGKAATP